MAEPFYPQLQEPALLQLRVVLDQMAQNPGYLSDAKCPYSETVKTFLGRMEATTAPAKVVELNTEAERLDYVEDEVVKVLGDLDTIVKSLGRAEISEQLAVQKARAGLVEKLVTYREKIWNMRETADFQHRVMAFLEDICSKEQIMQLKERLRGLKSVEGNAN